MKLVFYSILVREVEVGKKKILILIPARFASTRFPGKPLVKLLGRPMIEWVARNMNKPPKNSLYEIESVVVTDHDGIFDTVKNIGGNAVRIDDDVISGTQRIELAYERFYKDKNFDLVINVQGDEPLLELSAIEKLIEFHLNHPDLSIATMVKEKKGLDKDFHDPNKVKAVYSKTTGRCLYFSRAPVPFDRDLPNNPNGVWFLHIGVYSFRPSALTEFAKLPLGYFENLEKLEQLKALEFGQLIGAIEMNEVLMGVDHPHDVQSVEEVLRGRI